MSTKSSVKKLIDDTRDTIIQHSTSDQVNESTIFAAEHDWIRKRRSHPTVELPEGNPKKDSIGLALSGGGIRSATFNLGVLQAMERYGFFKKIDYLSTVSGGGYIGTCLSWFMAVKGLPFPFGTQREDHDALGGKVLAWLRVHGKYLTPGQGLSLWSLIASVLCGTLINLLVMVPVFLLLVWVLAARLPDGLQWLIPSWLQLKDYPLYKTTFFSLTLTIGHAFLLAFLIFCVTYALLSQKRRMQEWCAQRQYRIISGIVLMISIVLLIVGSVPITYFYLHEHLPTLLSSITIPGIFSTLSGIFFSKKDRNASNLLSPILLSLGLTLVCYAFFLLLYHLVLGGNYDPYDPSLPWYFWIFFLPLSLGLALFANINHVSMHRFYRNRLMEAYMPTMNEQGEYLDDEEEMNKADKCLFKDIQPSGAPYHLINTNLQTVGSDTPLLRERGGESFIFSPQYCGSKNTCYLPTSVYLGGGANLATAMAISGAAVDPNTFATRSRPLTFLMSLFNVRLGYWLPNPKYAKQKAKSIWWWYMFREMLGKGLTEKCLDIHLSDGGHFENLGMYELVKRKCKTIIVVDAGADHDYKFSDLARAIERVRVDFGAEVNINTTGISPSKKGIVSQKAWAVGTIEYLNSDEESIADFLYIKTTMISDLNEDIKGYWRQNSTFPDQTTTDQFFDEAQFEAYRELGFQTGRKIFKDHESLGEVIEALKEKEESPT